MRSRLPPILLRNLHSSLDVSSMAATAVIFRTLSTHSLTASSKLPSLPSLVSHPRSSLSYSTSSSSPLFGGLFSVHRRRDGDWMHLKRLGGKVSASQRGYRKVRGRPSARKKEKGKELKLDVRICLEEQLPDDSEILDIAEMLRLNVPMAMKLAFDGLKDSDHKTRDTSVYDVGQFEKVELSILLCNDEFICELNKDWRNEDHATDVLSMSQHVPELKLPLLALGDIIISVETAARQAEERGHTLLDEIRVLMVHGLLHLLGFDHELSEEAEAEMEDEEERVLKNLGWKGKGLIQSALNAESDETPLPKISDGRKKAGSLRFYQPKFSYIFCDMDGTLLNSKSQISATNAEALREASSRGVKVVIATGKTRPAAIALLKMVDLAGRDGIASEYSPGVFIQGLLVYGKQGREIHRRNLDPHVCKEAFNYSVEHNIPLIAFSENRCLTLFSHPLVDSLHTIYNEPKAEIMSSVDHLLSSGDVQKVLFLDTAEGVSGTLRPYWSEAIKGRASVVQAQADMLEIVPPGTSKGNGVKLLLDHFGATANEVMAIGDGENDVEMIEMAGLGVALSNGSEKTKSVANVIGVSNDEDGVADAIYRIKAEAKMEEEEERLGSKEKGSIQSAKAEEHGRKEAGSLRNYKPKFSYIFCDMDGTLLNSKSLVSATNAEAIREATSMGVKFVLATGKTRPAAITLLKMVDLADKDGIVSYSSPGVFIQGLLVYGKEGKEIHRTNLDPNVCKEAFHYSIEHNVPLVAFSENRLLTLFSHPLVDSLHTIYHEPRAEIMPSVEDLLSSGDVQKVLFLDTAEGVSGTLRPYWSEAIKGRASVVQAQADMLEIVPPGTSKGSGVKMLLDHFGVNANEVMAIGDGENDFEMIEMAGLGVALSNGSEKTKSVANVIGVSNDEDGVADAIYRYAF